VEENALSKMASPGSKQQQSKPALITEEEGIPLQARHKKKASAPNPLASMRAADSSRNSKKKKMNKFKKH
jgi:hypothetical protein